MIAYWFLISEQIKAATSISNKLTLLDIMIPNNGENTIHSILFCMPNILHLPRNSTTLADNCGSLTDSHLKGGKTSVPHNRSENLAPTTGPGKIRSRISDLGKSGPTICVPRKLGPGTFTLGPTESRNKSSASFCILVTTRRKVRE